MTKTKNNVRCLDLFCGAGGAGMGLHRAGFEMTGVDISPQPNYPFKFIHGDAMDQDLSGYDFIWASPPCQRYSGMSSCRKNLKEKYPDLISPVREMLLAWGGPWIIENVIGSPLRDPVVLCGSMFGLKTYRHRQFESNLSLTVPPHPPHTVPSSKAGHWKPGTFVSVAGHCAPMKLCREAMGIDWTNQRELALAIPPAYSEYLGRQVMALMAGGVELSV
jgi:DNA (cytosine-5)-methyltransferase 1